MINKQQIIEAKDCPVEAVDIPEWGGNAYIKTLTGAERMSLERDIARDESDALFRVVCATLSDNKGQLIFNYPDEIELLKTKSVKVVQRLFKESLRVNAMRPEDVEDAAKN